jgi:hypothetical protein
VNDHDLRIHKEIHAAFVKQVLHEAEMWKAAKERPLLIRRLRLAWVAIIGLLVALWLK